MYELKKQIIVLAIQLAVSIIFSFVPGWTTIELTLYEQILFSISLFIVFLLLDILWIVAHRLNLLSREAELWLLRNNGDWELSNIRTSFAKIIQNSYGKRDLFIAHFMKEFQRLSNKIKDVTEKQELRVAADHFLSVENVLDAFSGDDERIWRYTWPLSAGQKLFDDLPWKRYFEATTKMVIEKKIECIRSILILDNASLINDSGIKKLMDFFHSNERMDCRLILYDVYKKICSDNELPPHYIDFGIYGRRLLFRTEQYEPEIIGTFSKDANLINNYVNLFDAMWNADSVTIKNPSTVTEIVTLEELFKFDND
ncbi:MAG: hypothetical protein Q8N09_00145 [Thermodesulfovibrionia bacterium]|nr:hypothetical protein [Thermodesulfovibrionia bacterium]